MDTSSSASISSIIDPYATYNTNDSNYRSLRFVRDDIKVKYASHASGDRYEDDAARLMRGEPVDINSPLYPASTGIGASGERGVYVLAISCARVPIHGVAITPPEATGSVHTSARIADIITSGASITTLASSFTPNGGHTAATWIQGVSYVIIKIHSSSSTHLQSVTLLTLTPPAIVPAATVVFADSGRTTPYVQVEASSITRRGGAYTSPAVFFSVASRMRILADLDPMSMTRLECISLTASYADEVRLLHAAHSLARKALPLSALASQTLLASRDRVRRAISIVCEADVPAVEVGEVASSALLVSLSPSGVVQIDGVAGGTVCLLRGVEQPLAFSDGISSLRVQDDRGNTSDICTTSITISDEEHNIGWCTYRGPNDEQGGLIRVFDIPATDRAQHDAALAASDADGAEELRDALGAMYTATALETATMAARSVSSAGAGIEGHAVAHLSFSEDGEEVPFASCIFAAGETRQVAIVASSRVTWLRISLDGVVVVPYADVSGGYALLEIVIPPESEEGFHIFTADSDASTLVYATPVLFRVAPRVRLRPPVYPAYFTSGQIDGDTLNIGSGTASLELPRVDVIARVARRSGVSDIGVTVSGGLLRRSVEDEVLIMAGIRDDEKGVVGGHLLVAAAYDARPIAASSVGATAVGSSFDGGFDDRCPWLWRCASGEMQIQWNTDHPPTVACWTLWWRPKQSEGSAGVVSTILDMSSIGAISFRHADGCLEISETGVSPRKTATRLANPTGEWMSIIYNAGVLYVNAKEVPLIDIEDDPLGPSVFSAATATEFITSLGGGGTGVPFARAATLLGRDISRLRSTIVRALCVSSGVKSLSIRVGGVEMLAYATSTTATRGMYADFYLTSANPVFVYDAQLPLDVIAVGADAEDLDTMTIADISIRRSDAGDVRAICLYDAPLLATQMHYIAEAPDAMLDFVHADIELRSPIDPVALVRADIVTHTLQPEAVGWVDSKSYSSTYVTPAALVLQSVSPSVNLGVQGDIVLVFSSQIEVFPLTDDFEVFTIVNTATEEVKSIRGSMLSFFTNTLFIPNVSIAPLSYATTYAVVLRASNLHNANGRVPCAAATVTFRTILEPSDQAPL